MKTLKSLIYIYILFASQLNANPNWFWHNPWPMGGDIRLIKVFPSGIGYIAGEGGVIYKTINRGNSWERQESGNDGSFNDMHFLDENNGWMASYRGAANAPILKTIDGGETWTRAGIESWNHGYAIHAISPDTCFAILSFDSLIITENGGDSWISLAVDSLFLDNVFFMDRQNGWVIGNARWYQDDNRIYHTTDGGQSWDIRPVDYSTRL